MRFFEVLDFQHLVLAIFMGLIAALVIYISFRRDYRSKKVPELDEMHEGEPGGPEKPEAGSNPIPPVLIFLYAGFIVWLVVYVIYFGLRRGPL